MDNILKFTGIAGLALTVLLIIFRGIVRKAIFPTLTKTHGYKIMRLIVILTFAIALAAFILYYFIQNPISAQKNPPADVIIQGNHSVVAKEGGIVQMGEKRNAYVQDEIDTTFNDFIEEKMGDVVWLDTNIPVKGLAKNKNRPKYGDELPEHIQPLDSLEQKDPLGINYHLITDIIIKRFGQDEKFGMGGDLKNLKFTVHDLDNAEDDYATYYREGVTYQISVDEKNRGAIRVFIANDGIKIRGNFKIMNFLIAGTQGYRTASLYTTQ